MFVTEIITETCEYTSNKYILVLWNKFITAVLLY